jgi:hypothetical protein
MEWQQQINDKSTMVQILRWNMRWLSASVGCIRIRESQKRCHPLGFYTSHRHVQWSVQNVQSLQTTCLQISGLHKVGTGGLISLALLQSQKRIQQEQSTHTPTDLVAYSSLAVVSLSVSVSLYELRHWIVSRNSCPFTGCGTSVRIVSVSLNELRHWIESRNSCSLSGCDTSVRGVSLCSAGQVISFFPCSTFVIIVSSSRPNTPLMRSRFKESHNNVEKLKP